MLDKINPLSVDRGLVTAPAGCGKTHLITSALKEHACSKPVLVLTHTNAGVVALRQRLQLLGVPSKGFYLATIDGWALQLIKTFPKRSGHDPAITELRSPDRDYPLIRKAAARLVMSKHIVGVLSASFSRLLVDEYQDCSRSQHQLIAAMAKHLPTCVFGDPMQAIFNFGSDGIVDWETEVKGFFPSVGVLSKPWRWINQREEALGEWLLKVRSDLQCGVPIDIRKAPSSVTWKKVDGEPQVQNELRRKAASYKPPSKTGKIVVIGDSRNPGVRHQLARSVPGAVVVEPVTLQDLIDFAEMFGAPQSRTLSRLLEFARGAMTGVSKLNLESRVAVLKKGTQRKAPNTVEKAAFSFGECPSYGWAAVLLKEISYSKGIRTFRPTLLRACIETLQLASQAGDLSLREAAIQVREKFRMHGRKLPRRAIGSTLLLKGLEAEVAVVLAADELDARNLYVAMTRGSRRLVICSPDPIFSPGPV